MYGQWYRKAFWADASPLTLHLTHAAMQRLLRFHKGRHKCQRISASDTAFLDI